MLWPRLTLAYAINIKRGEANVNFTPTLFTSTASRKRMSNRDCDWAMNWHLKAPAWKIVEHQQTPSHLKDRSWRLRFSLAKVMQGQFRLVNNKVKSQINAKSTRPERIKICYFRRFHRLHLRFAQQKYCNGIMFSWSNIAFKFISGKTHVGCTVMPLTFSCSQDSREINGMEVGGSNAQPSHRPS